MAARGLTVNLDTPSVVIPGDRVLLERLVGNLVENAVRHNVSGGWIRVSVTPSTGSGGFAQIVVASSGPVIDADSAAELFEPFRQGARGRTERRGSGLGLSIVQAIAAAHGGLAVATPTAGWRTDGDRATAGGDPGRSAPFGRAGSLRALFAVTRRRSPPRPGARSVTAGALTPRRAGTAARSPAPRRRSGPGTGLSRRARTATPHR